MSLLKSFGPSIRHRDADGRLLQRGYQWDERTQFRVRRILGLLIVSGVATVVVGFNLGIAAILPGYFAVCAAAILAVNRLWRRIIIFQADGSVLTPHGLPCRIGKRKLPVEHAAITSIEAVKDGEWVGVLAYTDEGESYVLSHLERLADARLVAVQLTKALHEMRQSLAVVSDARPARSARELVQIY